MGKEKVGVPPHHVTAFNVLHRELEVRLNVH